MDKQTAIFTTSQVAEHFRVDASTVRRWVAKKRIRPDGEATTLGGHYRFTAAELERVARRTVD